MERLAGGKTEATILRFTQGITFPAHKDDLVHAARKNGAALQRLPANELADERELLAVYPRLDE
jgi:hypothetical protein